MLPNGEPGELLPPLTRLVGELEFERAAHHASMTTDRIPLVPAASVPPRNRSTTRSVIRRLRPDIRRRSPPVRSTGEAGNSPCRRRHQIGFLHHTRAHGRGVRRTGMCRSPASSMSISTVAATRSAVTVRAGRTHHLTDRPRPAPAPAATTRVRRSRSVKMPNSPGAAGSARRTPRRSVMCRTASRTEVSAEVNTGSACAPGHRRPRERRPFATRHARRLRPAAEVARNESPAGLVTPTGPAIPATGSACSARWLAR